MYSPRMPRPRILAEPKDRETNSMVVMPLGTDSGKKSRMKTVTKAKNTAPVKLRPPKAVKRCSGKRLNESEAKLNSPILSGSIFSSAKCEKSLAPQTGQARSDGANMALELFAKKIGMRTGAGGHQHQRIFKNLIDQQPIRFDMAFPEITV